METKGNRINFAISQIWSVSIQPAACSTCWSLPNIELARMSLQSFMQAFCHLLTMCHTIPSSPYSCLQSEYSPSSKENDNDRNRRSYWSRLQRSSWEDKPVLPQTKRPRKPHQRFWPQNTECRAFVNTQAVEFVIWNCVSCRSVKAWPVKFSSFLTRQYCL